MQKFVITELAGREVAGMRNPGAGITIELSEKQAEHPLRLGHIRRPAARKSTTRKSADPHAKEG